MRRWTIRIGVVVALVAIFLVARRTVLKPEPIGTTPQGGGEAPEG